MLAAMLLLHVQALRSMNYMLNLITYNSIMYVLYNMPKSHSYIQWLLMVNIHFILISEADQPSYHFFQRGAQEI